MGQGLRIDVAEQQGRLSIAALTGDLDMTTVAEAYQGTTALLVDRPDLILDLSGVAFCDSSGFNVLLRLHRRAVEAGGWLALAAPTPQLGRLLALTGVDAALAVYNSIDEARADHTS